MERRTMEATSGNLPGPGAVSSRLLTTADSSNVPGAAVAVRLRQLGRYIILGQLGAGGMSFVHEAYDPELDRKVALKILRGVAGGVSMQGRLLREGQALARINHANVVRVYDVGIDQGQLYIAMERIEGVTLRAWLAETRRTRAEILRVFIAAGRGLAEAHAAGIIHRDVKPENALIDASGTLRLVDFGLARAAIDEPEPHDGGLVTAPGLGMPFTQVGAVIGTPAYMAPEQLAGASVDARVDVFAICVALFEALYGARPFAGETVPQLIASIERGPPARPPRGGSQALHALLVRGLAADPGDRWPTIAALTDRLQALARPSRWIAIAGTVLVGALGVGVFATLPGAPQPCSGVGAEIVDTWGPAIAASVGEAFTPGASGYVDATWRRVLPQLGGYAERWSATRLAVCEAREQGAVSERLHDLEVACLESRRQSLAATVAVVRRRGGAMVDELETLVESLPELASCRDPARVQVRWAPPDDPAAAARVAALEGRLVDAEASMVGGDMARADELVKGIAGELSGLPAAALAAELARVEAALAERLGQAEAMRAAQQRRFTAALAIADHEAAGLAAAELMGEGYEASASSGAEETWQAVAEALLAGPAIRPLARATVKAQSGELATRRGDLKGALQAVEAGLAIAHEGPGIPWALHARLLEQALAIEVMLGRHEKQAARLGELVALLADNRADGHPDQVKARTVQAEALLNRGDLAGGAAALDDAEAMLVRGGLARADLSFELAALRVLHAAYRGDLPGLDAMAAKALALAGSPRDRLRVHAYVGSTYSNAGQHERAIAAMEAGMAATAGDQPPELLLRRREVQLQLGNCYLGAGRYDEAEAAYRAVVSNLSEESDDNFLLTEAKVGLAQVLLGRGEWAQARRELAALEARAAGRVLPPGYIGNLHFAFAQALWGPEDRRPAPAEAARAREHAALAIRDFTGVPGAEPTLAEIEAWQAAHAAARSER